MKRNVLFMLPVLVFILSLVAACNGKKDVKEAGVYYTCPMHPEVKKEEPGQCPVCNMDLVKKEDPSGHRH